MIKNNRVCKVCGSEYHFCPTCAGVSVTDKYKTMFCSKNCRDIFHTISRYFVKDVSKEEAKDILLSLDLSNRAKFNDSIKADIDEVMGLNRKQFKKKEEHVVADVDKQTIAGEI
jgi:hypothetical protein